MWFSESKYISIPILERYMKGLDTRNPSEVQVIITSPSYKIIEDDLVPQFVANPENYANQISDLSERINVLMTMFSR